MDAENRERSVCYQRRVDAVGKLFSLPPRTAREMIGDDYEPILD